LLVLLSDSYRDTFVEGAAKGSHGVALLVGAVALEVWRLG
jgi:hypothetical protein